MISSEIFVNALQANGVNFFTGVPDSLLKNVCAYITDNVDKNRNIISANEGSAIGIAAGHYLATGEIPMVYMQNSGIGNAVNPLLSLTDEKVYSIPILLLIGWRGEPGVHDEPQHIKQGEVTLSLLEAMNIPYSILPLEQDDAKETIKTIKTVIRECLSHKKPHALIVRKNTFDTYKLNKKIENENPVIREEALKIVVGNIPSDSIIVSTTGKLSRELYELRDKKNQSHESDFLTVGSMGHSSSIALGIALSKPNRKVICLDGDGAFIMHMGAISNIGDLSPKNFIHIVFNNGAHESVGGQPTLGYKIDMPKIALACGYRSAITVSKKEEIEKAIERAIEDDGPSMIEIRVGINSREDLGRPKTSPKENKDNFMSFISLK